MALEFELAGSQIDGARDYQEDAFLITHLTDGQGRPAALIIIADGMGGHAAGNVASNMSVQAFNKHVTANYPSDNPAEILHECVIKANNSVKDTVRETPALSGMGCTLVAAILETGKIWWASVGDSHLYLIRDKQRRKINADHSYGGFLDRMAAAGTPVEPEPGLARNMLMSAITGDEINEIDVSTEPLELKIGDRVMLCSDGMDTLSEGKFIQFSDWSGSPKECVNALLEAVKDAAMPRQDNTTIVVVDVKDKAGAVASAPPPAASAPAAEAPHSAEIPAQPASAGPSWQPPVEPARKKAGAFAWVAAVLIAILIVGGYFVFTGQQGPTPPPVTVESDEPGAIEQNLDVVAGDAPVAVSGTETPADEITPTVSGIDAGGAATGTGEEFQDRLRDGTQGPVMVVMPAGSYEMGSPGSSGNTDERPRHTVKLDRYAIGKYEITFTQYEKFARATGREIPDNMSLDKGTHPVFNVTWDDARAYTRWLSDQTGETYTLPSESRWEYAAGAGARSSFWWGYEEEPNRAHCFGCETGLNSRLPTRIGAFEANPFGLYDTAGNVAEWVQDCWHDDYEGAPSTGEVWEGGNCDVRVVRGGSYNSPPQSIRHASRDRFKSDARYDNIGIRVVREVD